MNKTQFINIWASEGKKEEMEVDLKAVIKDALEDQRIFTTDLKGLEL